MKNYLVPNKFSNIQFDLLADFQPLVITEISYSGAKVNFFVTYVIF